MNVTKLLLFVCWYLASLTPRLASPRAKQVPHDTILQGHLVCTLCLVPLEINAIGLKACNQMRVFSPLYQN